MGKFTISAHADSIPALMTSIEAEFKTKSYASGNLVAMKTAAKEIVLSIAKVNAESVTVIIDIDIQYSGTGAQFLYAGPIYNPCAKDSNDCPFTKKTFDEISFEFKYGHSVVAIYKKLPCFKE